MLGPGVDAVVDTGSWSEPPVFGELRRRGVGDEEMRKVFNLGIGMVLAVPGDAVATALDQLDGHGHRPAVIGEVVAGSGAVVLR
jgi:phosphoribosylformylglycinamidine cyclo-ligase